MFQIVKVYILEYLIFKIGLNCAYFMAGFLQAFITLSGFVIYIFCYFLILQLILNIIQDRLIFNI